MEYKFNNSFGFTEAHNTSLSSRSRLSIRYDTIDYKLIATLLT